METKICYTCKKEKSVSDFKKKNIGKDGKQRYSSSCLECREEYFKNYRNRPEIKDSRKEYDKQRYQEKREEILENKKEYHQKNKEVILEKKREYRSTKEYWELNKKWRDENRDKLRQNMKNYRERYPLINSWRNILHRTLRYLGKPKECHTIEALGYSAEDLKNHLEPMLKENMNWENYGDVWEIDHIRPLSSFSKDSTPAEVNALSNLQPLYKEENRLKFNYY